MSLTQVYCSAEQPEIDIVFVHGLHGHPFDTWTSKTGCFWPYDLLPGTLGKVRILTYGYCASIGTFIDTDEANSLPTQAESFALILVENRKRLSCSDRPIIYVCHSLGGVLVKELLLHCRENSSYNSVYLNSIYRSTCGILFLGTPHNTNGLGWNSIVQSISSAVLGKEYIQPSLHEQGEPSSQVRGSTIQNISQNFFRFTKAFPISFFYETLPVHGSVPVLERTSAAPCIPGTIQIGVPSHHLNLPKFNSINESGYSAIAGVLNDYALAARKGDSLDDGVSDSTAALPSLKGHGESSVPKEPLFIVPTDLHPNATFFGKRTDFDRLHSILTSSSRLYPKAVVISGPPGSGKTYLAREYIWTHRSSYPGGIFWINATSLQSIHSGLENVAHALQACLGHTEPEVHNLLQQIHDYLSVLDKWLLIFDGLDPPENDKTIDYLRRIVPANRTGSILYTSGDGTLPNKQQLYHPYRLKISPLPVEEACKLLFTKLGVRKPLERQVRKAALIAMHYEGLPLAIHAVCNYLSAMAKPIERFRIDSRLTNTMLNETFLRILDRLYSEKQFGSLNLINIVSFYSSQLNVDFLRLGAGAVEKYDIHICRDNDDLDAILQVLTRYGLIEDASDDDTSESSGFRESGNVLRNEGNMTTIKIHTVVRDDPYNSWLLAAFEVLSSSYKKMRSRFLGTQGHEGGWDTAKYRTHCEDYLLHLQSLAEHFPRKGSVSSELSGLFESLKRMNKSVLEDIARLDSGHSASSAGEPLPSHTQHNNQSQISADHYDDGEWEIVNTNRVRETRTQKQDGLRGWAKHTVMPILTQLLPKVNTEANINRHPEIGFPGPEGSGYFIRGRAQSDDSPFIPTVADPRHSMRAMTHPSVFLPGELPSSPASRKRGGDEE
ncbi:hypothetical protein BDV59DRAFT_174033 [Aspergillus ambiguus]|uniref:uncharacterized protein n=1 Tax=Aspergillus ambiguus TaxID=176160 RepID=UPI003CCDBD9C